MTDQEIEEILSKAEEQVQRVEHHEIVPVMEYVPDNTQTEKKAKSLLHRFVVNVVYPIVAGILLAVLLTQVIFFHAKVPSGSMESTIMTNDMILAARFAYWGGLDPDHGDIIVFWSEEYKEFMVKRVIGCPGDTVELKNDAVYVNGVKISDDYTTGVTVALHSGEDKWEVPEDSYFVMGDNRESSADSRYWINTFVPNSEVYAKYLFRYRLGFRDGEWAFEWNHPIDFYETATPEE